MAKGKPARTARKASAFGLTEITDNKLLNKPAVFLVKNTADKDNIDLQEQFKGLKIEGKREGYGLPGGGVKDEDYENFDDGVMREVEGESGLTIVRARQLEEIPVNKLLLIGKKTRVKTERLLRQHLYYGKDRPPLDWLINYDISYLLENPVPVYKIQVKWEGSPAQRLLMRTKKYLISSGHSTQAELDSTGIYVDFDEVPDLDPVKDLKLDSREVHEIKGFGLFTIPWILEQLEQSETEHSEWRQYKDLYDHSEDRKNMAEPVYPEPSPIYFVHMKIIERAYKLKLLAAA